MPRSRRQRRVKRRCSCQTAPSVNTRPGRRRDCCHLTHWGRDKMAAVSQTTPSNAFSWMKMLEFRLRFHWSLFLRVQLTLFQHCFRYWLGAVQATSHYLNQWWLVYWRIYASLGLNELTPADAYAGYDSILGRSFNLNTDIVLGYLANKTSTTVCRPPCVQVKDFSIH